jgi:secreted trypsin-like serine protease
MVHRRLILFIALVLGQVSCTSLKDSLRESLAIRSDMNAERDIVYKGARPSHIVNGHEVDFSDKTAKMAVMLVINREGNLSVCTGVVIDRKTVLTAAHCVFKAEPKNVEVVFSTRSGPKSPVRAHTIGEKIIVHEKYDGKPENYSDLALLRLASEVPADYSPVSLYESGEKILGDDVLLIGYGITGELKKDSMTLRKTTKSLKNDLHLKDSFIGIEQTSKTGGFCRGDSGAPVLVKVKDGTKVIGVNSFTVGLEENKECHTASVAILVPHFANWIKANAAKF